MRIFVSQLLINMLQPLTCCQAVVGLVWQVDAGALLGLGTCILSVLWVFYRHFKLRSGVTLGSLSVIRSRLSQDSEA